jgi:malate dehydrogenase
MERKDLIDRNASIMKEHVIAMYSYDIYNFCQGGAIERHADRNVKVIVIANPANTNCLLASEFAPSIPKTNFTCLTRLDHDRLSGLIANKVNDMYPDQPRINSADVRGIAVFGNHSTTQVPHVDSATVRVGGVWRGVRDVITDSTWLDAELPVRLQNRGAEIMKYLEASSAMSAARAITRHLHDWLGPVSASSEGGTFSMGVTSDGNPYGMPEGLVFSFPCRRAANSAPGSYEIVSGLEMSAAHRDALVKTVEELVGERTLAA